MSDDTISRQAAIDALNVGAELLRRVLDETDVVGAERAKYEWGLGLIESSISDMKELPSASPCADAESYKRGWNDAVEAIMGVALSIEERKKGKWVTYVISMVDGEGCRCSECGFEGVPYWDFCPNCGSYNGGET